MFLTAFCQRLLIPPRRVVFSVALCRSRVTRTRLSLGLVASMLSVYLPQDEKFWQRGDKSTHEVGRYIVL